MSGQIPNQELLQFHDSFIELQSLCAFFCDSVVALATTRLDMDKRSINGLHIFAGQIQHRAKILDEQLLNLRTDKTNP